VELSHKATVALNGWAVQYRVNKELDKLKAEIEKKMPAKGGVLVCVGIQEWEMPDAAGAKAQSFLSIHIAGFGTDYNSVLQHYQSQPSLLQGAPKGWLRKDVFIWATRE